MTDTHPHDLNLTASEPDMAADVEVTLNALNKALCAAIGQDADEIVGYELTVQGGMFPELRVFVPPPLTDDGHPVDRWSVALGRALRSATFIVLPGGDSEAPPVQRPGSVLPHGTDLPAVLHPEEAAATVLAMMADVLNGAGCDPDTRDMLSRSARELALMFEQRLIDYVQNADMAAEAGEAPTDG